MSIIYILIIYIIGLFAGFYNNPIAFNIKNLVNRIIPLIAILITSEFIRNTYITRENKISKVIITIALILVDISIDINLYKIFDLEEILSLIGRVILPAISINLLANYMTNKFGIMPSIIYKIILSMYSYVFPILPDIYIFFLSALEFIYPYIVFVLLDFTFSRRQFKQAMKKDTFEIILTILMLIISIGIVLLVSCKFKYGVLVVGSSSMTGSIDMGDVILYEKVEYQNLEEDQVIVFYDEDRITIHRIQDIQILNNERIIYTKGDANQTQDTGYRVEENIIGVVKLKIQNVGWPTIWANRMFTK